VLTSALTRFKGTGYAHISIDAGSFHGNKVLDFAILLTGPNHQRDGDFLLYRSFDVVDGDQRFYMEAALDTIEQLDNEGIIIYSIVGDGLSAQYSALSPYSPTSIQNSENYLRRLPKVENIIFIYCACHLLNLALGDALKASSSVAAVDKYVTRLARVLLKKEFRQKIGRRCPTYSQTRWCHAYLLCLFFAKNYQAILQAGIRIPCDMLAYGILLEPLFLLISQFEDRKMQFYMRERKLAKFYARMSLLGQKYDTTPFIKSHSTLLQNVVLLRFATDRSNHNLSLVADALTIQVCPPSGTIVTDLSGLFMDNLYEQIVPEREIARTVAEPDIEEEEEFHEEEEDKSTEPFQTLGNHFLQDDIDRVLVQLTDKITAIKRDDTERGLYETGRILITDYGTKPNWPEGQISMCMTQFSRWLSLAATDPSLIHVINLRPSLLWRSFGTSSH
jgi:hypothetical protein